MKVGLVPVNIGVTKVADMVGIAQQAEASNFESVWTFEHVIVPEDYQSRYPYSPSGKMGVSPDTNFVDPLIALTAYSDSNQKTALGYRRQYLIPVKSALSGQTSRESGFYFQRPLNVGSGHRLAARRI